MNSIVGDLNEIFLCGVSAVQPKHIFQSKCFCINDTKTSIVCQFNESRVEVDLRDRQCHLVGFGKAVFGMASELSGVLGERLMSGIISVPLHTIEKFSQIQLPASIQVLEGAKNNLPDAAAESAAIKIMEFVDNLNKNDILFVLISGGGSALLPLPCAGVTLDEKLDVIKKLANKGATISDINRVRIDLSQTKGGKLAAIGAKRTHRVIGLIISDIIGDPLDLIASGPTVIKSEKNKISSIDVLKHYDLWNTLASNIQNAITANSTTKIHLEAKNVENLIIANNTIAVNAALNAIKEKNSLGMILSKQIDGNVSEISQMYFKLAEAIQKFKHRKIDENKFVDQITSTQRTLKFEKNFLDNVLELIAQSEAEAKDFCLIGAGEPTVEVIGNGLGGRNQELALRFSRKCFDDKLLHNVWLLSAGTDGIDGK